MSENVTASREPSAAPGPLLQMMTGYQVTQALYVAAKLGIADLLSDGPLSCDDLAGKTGTHSPSLRRLLRALASVGVFSEVVPGRFALTPLAALLRSADPNSVRALAIMYAEEQYRAWGDMLYSVRTGQPAFEHQFGMGVFEYFAQNPQAGAVFNEAMTGLTIQVAASVAATYDFSKFATIVDIGGNRGTVLAAILQRHSGSRGILFDRPYVVATAGEVLAAAGVENRCTTIGGDFFEAVPPGGDAYLLASILHDWDDDRCVEILRRCRQVMPDNGKLLVVELVLPPGGDEPFIGKWMDLHMLVMASGRERTEEEYGKVFLAAGFDLKSVHPLPNGQSIVEAVPT
jgi:O-methyltransferase/methyltransferase family protein